MAIESDNRDQIARISAYFSENPMQDGNSQSDEALARAHDLLVGEMGNASNISDTSAALSSAANQISGPDSQIRAADVDNRIEGGETDLIRDDLLFQSPDWERSTGRKDGESFDLIDS